MADQEDPPRKHYQLKPKEFERVNTIIPGALPPAPAAPPPPATEHAAPPAPSPADALANVNDRDPSGRIDLHDIIRHGAAGVPVRGNPSSATTAGKLNDVQSALHAEHERQKAAGFFDVDPGDDKVRKRRIRRYWIAMVSANTPLAAVAIAVNPTRDLGPASAIVFVCTIAGIGMISATLTWHTFFLRTER